MSSVRFVAILATLFVVACAAPFAEEAVQPLADPVEWRLPTTIEPLMYNVTLQPYLSDSDGSKRFTFDGVVFIEIKSLQNTDIIKLHSKNLNYTAKRCYAKSTPNVEISLTEVEKDSQTDIWTLRTGSPLTANVAYVLHFIYVGSMDDDMHGFYRSSYTDENNEVKWLGSTQFQTNHARRAFPSFDEPRFKANFSVSLIRLKKMKTVSNTEVAHVDSLNNGWYKDVYKTTPKMSTYLVAFIVSEFNERTNGLFSIVARPEYYDQTAYAHDAGQRILKDLGDYFGINYYQMGLEKMHMAAIPDFSAGAMENWGLLTYRERALLYDPSTTILKDKQYIAAVVAHEQAHMWFGDYVTCQWWSYTWLNEGFARYFQYFATDKTEPQFHIGSQFTVDQIQAVMSMDSMNATNPMTDLNTNTPSDLSRMFNSISYNKGASVIRMTKHILGEQNFQKSLGEYLKQNAFKNTVPKDLFDFWAPYWPSAFATHMEEYFKTFTEQVGYPVIMVDVAANSVATGFRISQQRFLLKENDGSDPNLIYRVPFTYTTSSEKDFNDTNTKTFVTATPYDHDHGKTFDWVIANVQQVGYYRVNYDTGNWQAIQRALLSSNFGGIHELNRAQIVDDLLNLARAGHVQYNLTFNVLDFLSKETHYLPWLAAFNGLSYLGIRMGKDNKEFSNYILHSTAHAYFTLGFEEKKSDTALDIYNRAQVLSSACKYGHSGCIAKAKEYFASLHSVPVNIRAAVYCSSIRHGSEADFDHLWTHGLHMNVATETDVILTALGCTKDAKLIEKYFKMILSDAIRKQDKSSALSALYTSNNENVEPVFKLVTDNYVVLAEAMGGYDSVATVISNIASRFTETSQETALKDFNVKNKSKFGSSASTLEMAESTVAENFKWASANVKNIKTVLSYRSGGASFRSLSALTIFLVACVSFMLK